MKVECGERGGGTLPRGRLLPLMQANTDYVHRDEIREIVSSILLKGFQKLQTSSEPLLNLVYHNIKMKAYITVEGGGDILPRDRLPPLPQANIDEIGEIVSSILLNSFQKLQITRLFSIPFIII